MSPRNSGRIPQLMGIADPNSECGHMVMTRKRDESVVISCTETGRIFAVISANEIQGASVKLGCRSPLNVSVDRESVYLKRAANKLNEQLSETPEGASVEIIQKIKEIETWLNKYKPQQ